MRVSIEWLKTMVEVPDDTKAFCDRLDLTGTGVEGVERTGAQLDDICVGHILTRDKHPDADTLWVTTVDVGQCNLDENGKPVPLQIVCGAQNFVAGDKVPVALVGAVMPDGAKIKKSKLRGVESCGMNCSGRELGVSADASGLMILSADAPVGMPISDYLALSDTVLDLEITPNRPDCLSMKGMAREVGAMYGREWTCEEYTCETTAEKVSDLVSVRIDDDERCPRYTARVIRNVHVGPSPEWLAKRIIASGARPINNVVDVTNYILFLLGQPLHAFDYDKLPKGTDGKVSIVVRPAHDDEPFTTLDGVERTLIPDMTVITDGKNPVALAGVMGGLDTEVTEQTTTVLLESATFSTSHTSRTSRNLSLISESSMRYERGVDAASCEYNSLQAAALMAKICGGEVAGGVVDVYPIDAQAPEMDFRIGRFRTFIGAECPREVVCDVLSRLGCEVSDDGSDVLHIVAPTYRPDLTREIDLYEEVLRLWGMEKVEMTLPGGRGRIGGRTVEQRRLELIGAVLRSCGLNETQTYSFCPPDDLQRLRMSGEGRGEAVELLNPMSSEQSVMRQSIIPGLLRSVAYNQSHGVDNVHLYEEGVVFAAAEGRKKPKERKVLAAVMCGSWNEPGWNEPVTQLDFFDVKGIIDKLLRELCIDKVHYKALDPESAEHLQPGRAAEVFSAGVQIGWLGEIHPLAVEAFDAKGSIAAFELDVKALLQCAADSRPFVDVPRYPAVDMDLALVVDEDVTAERLTQAITSAGGKLLSDVRLFDVYRDERKLGHGRKSLAFSLRYQAPDRTLSAEEVEKQHERLIKKVCGATGAQVRG